MSAIVALLLVIPTWSYAIEDIILIDKTWAKEFGLQIRWTTAGDDTVYVKLEFARQGELKDYHSVSLEIRDGRKLLFSSTLKEEESEPGRVVVAFYTDRAKLDQITLKVGTQNGLERSGLASGELG